MKSLAAKLALASLLLTASGVFAGELLDRLVATVDNVPILQSEWDHAVALEALEQGRTVASYSEQERLAVLNRLVDQQLIRTQMGDDGLDPADEAQIQKQVASIRAALSHAQTDEDWKQLLGSYGVRDDTLRAKVARELQVMRFVDLRLRPASRVERADVEDYYNNTLLPQLRKQGAQEQSLTQVYSKIEEVLRQQRIDDLLAAWLQQLRGQSNIDWIGVKNAPGDDSALPAAPAGGH